MNTNPGRVIYPEYGLRDRSDQDTGLQWGKSDKKIVVRDNLIFCDTRDCVGEQSIKDTQAVFKLRGSRPDFTQNISLVSGLGVTPIVITSTGTVTSTDIKNGDKIAVSGVQGNTSSNGIWKIQNIVVGTPTTFELQGSVGNGNYAGGGVYTRQADPGWPIIKDTTSHITGNEMFIKLPKKLKVVRSLSLIHTVIPRDIIPLTTYLPDFIEYTQFSDVDVPNCSEVRAATTVSGTLATDFENGDTIDGVVLSTNDRILLKDQASAIENGVYIVQASGAPVRSFDVPANMPAAEILNYYVTTTEGTVNIMTTFRCSVATGVVGVGALTFTSMVGIPITWASYIPQEKELTEFRTIGFYSTPLDLFRTYINGSFSLPNQYTPPPLKLWNPTVGGANHQLQPYPHQVVPTYTSDTFSVSGKSGDFYVILSGYGLYDLNDWTYRLDPDDLTNNIFTRIARTLMLLAIVRSQSYRSADYIELIINSVTVTNGSTSVDHYGYGDYQRFVPGPGLGMHYQPGTSDSADPTVTRTDSPVPFPNFRGNVWGPYNSPGDRFQRTGLLDCVQDLFLNGDLSNIFGASIIKPWVNVECIPTDNTFGLHFPGFIQVTFGNIEQATNPNIMNAMRVVSNGYGALDVLNLGSDATFTNVFLNSGGQGPDIKGIPANGYSTTGTGGAWVDTEVVSGGNTGIFGDEIAAGPLDTTAVTTEVSNAATAVGDNTGSAPITNRVAFYDLGPNANNFSIQINKFKLWAITELPDTNIVMSIFQAERDSRVQSINQAQTSAILSCPIRLNLGTTSGTQEYVENIQAFLASSSEYWEKRYLNPLQSLYKLNIKFTTYGGDPIPLEKMLQPRRSVVLLQAFERIFGPTVANLFSAINPRNNTISFLFDPLDPRLIGREKRNLSLVFKVQTYEYESPGLYLGMVKDMLEAEIEKNDNDHPFTVRASNFQDYR